MNGNPEPRVYLEPTQASGRAFVMRHLQGSVIMLNLLRFRRVADYWLLKHPSVEQRRLSDISNTLCHFCTQVVASFYFWVLAGHS